MPKQSGKGSTVLFLSARRHRSPSGERICGRWRKGVVHSTCIHTYVFVFIIINITYVSACICILVQTTHMHRDPGISTDVYMNTVAPKSHLEHIQAWVYMMYS